MVVDGAGWKLNMLEARFLLLTSATQLPQD